jgi:3-hydroxybutyryl-CoA dehydrogenase
LDNFRPRIKNGLDLAVLKGKLTMDRAERAGRMVSETGNLSELEGADLIIEAVVEDLAVKRELFARVSKLFPDVILATNTSSLRVQDIAEAVAIPERMLGMHFFNPPVAMKLVELIRAPKTDSDVFRMAWDFAGSGLRKTPIDVKDVPGFVVNRVMRPYYVEAQRRAGSGFAAIDAAARAGGLPMGPFELMDLIGLDVNYAITRSMYEAFGKPERFEPPALQGELVRLGHLGRKAGRGFYLYENGKSAGENPQTASLVDKTGALSAGEAFVRIMSAIAAEAELALNQGVAGISDIDLAIRLAMNFPKGPFEWQKSQSSAS